MCHGVRMAPLPSADRSRPVRIGLACRAETRDAYVMPADVARLRNIGEFVYRPFDVGDFPDPCDEAALLEFAGELDALVVCHGSPRVTETVIAASRLRFIGELEGDRFAHRIDVPAAARRGVTVVDTTHGSSVPVAEWALALALVGLRNAGALFRRLIGHEPVLSNRIERAADPLYRQRELAGREVAMLGFGHIGWRLTELLRPFSARVLVYDPYVPRELAAVAGVTFTSLERALGAEVVICLLPLTPATERLISAPQLERLAPGSVFVNVSRGKVVDSAALVARLRRGDLVAALDVYDPEPIAEHDPIRDLPNVFLSPHIAGVTVEAERRFFTLMTDELLAFFSGHEPSHQLTEQVVGLRRGLITESERIVSERKGVPP
jgi:phosphoglycerate dehydrogenase-like enzyme